MQIPWENFNLFSDNIPRNVFVVFGLLAILKILWNILRFVWMYFLRPSKNLRKYGEWAIVTGCTDGIGKAIAEEFAKRKLNVILVSRSQSKLDEQEKEISSKFNVQTKTVAIDFSSSSPNLFEPVKSAISGLQVGILVNNVGVAYDHADYLHNVELSKIQQLIQVNIMGTIQMTTIVLPAMLERKRGAIINVSSGSSLVSEPLYAVYAGTKAFMNTYSESLHYEYKEFGIHVQCQLPAFVATKMSKIRNSSFFVASPTAYARSFVSKIGYEPIVISYWTHALQLGAALHLIPKPIICNSLLSKTKGLRARALKKKQQ